MRAVLQSLRAATLLLLACACVAACDESLSGSERWCDGLCSAVFRCGQQPANCRGECVSERPGLAKLSDAAAAAEGACISGVTCRAITDEETWRSETSACWEETVANATPTASSRAFCEAQARAWFDCGYLYSGELCAKEYSVWSDAVLDRMSACALTATCATLADCERSAVEEP
jgi:hypothetical protein